MVVEVVKSDQISNIDGFHMVSSGLIKISGSSYPHIMHDLIQSSKCDFTIFENFRTCQGVEALQIYLMVMLRYHISSKVPKLSQI